MSINGRGGYDPAGQPHTAHSTATNRPASTMPTSWRRGRPRNGDDARRWIARDGIDRYLEQGPSATRMLELARAGAERPYTGSRSVFGEAVRRMRQGRTQQLATASVPLRFEGLPGEYLQVDRGEMRAFAFAQQAPATRYFLACRLKHGRWSFLRLTQDMRRETLLRGMVECLAGGRHPARRSGPGG
jgi:hypothetical protein